MKRITLVCSAGMSTSLLVSKMNIAAMNNGEDVIIKACPENEFDKVADITDILLLGPQVCYMLEKMKIVYGPKGMKIAVIDSMDYGTMNGEKVLKFALNI